MKPDLASLELKRPDLEEVRRAMAAKIREGLVSGEGGIAALPTYLPPPRTGVEGTALVLDLGGTNIRAATVEIPARGTARLTREPLIRPLEPEWETAEAFFEFQAGLALSLAPPAGLPLGYCFSYPARSLPGGDAVHLQWHKGLDVPGVVGRRVGELLAGSLERRGYCPSRVRVLNDTVAALLGGDLVHRKGNFSAFIGLIVGTGTNMAAYFPPFLLGERIPEEFREMDLMAVNLESGNFRPPCLSPFDDELDAGREDAGRQRLEKAVSGKFLPPLFAYILGGRTAPPYPETREIFARAAGSRSREGDIARRITGRSADLVAAGLAGLIDVLETDGRIGILAEGGVISNHPEYRRRVTETLADLLDDHPARPARFELLRLEYANLIGAAAAAA